MWVKTLTGKTTTAIQASLAIYNPFQARLRQALRQRNDAMIAADCDWAYRYACHLLSFFLFSNYSPTGDVIAFLTVMQLQSHCTPSRGTSTLHHDCNTSAHRQHLLLHPIGGRISCGSILPSIGGLHLHGDYTDIRRQPDDHTGGRVF